MSRDFEQNMEFDLHVILTSQSCVKPYNMNIYTIENLAINELS